MVDFAVRKIMWTKSREVNSHFLFLVTNDDYPNEVVEDESMNGYREKVGSLLQNTTTTSSFKVQTDMEAGAQLDQPMGIVAFTLSETNMTSHPKMDGWKTFSFPFGGWPIFRCELLVLEGMSM